MLTSATRDFQHLTIGRDQQVFWIGLDVKNSNRNLLTPEVLAELQQAYQLAQALRVRALVLYSNRPEVFSAGLDLSLLQNNPDPQKLLAFLKAGQAFCEQLSSTSMLSLAMVEGECLGAGLSLALACHYCVATTHWQSRFSFPEVQQGIHPVWGGSSRSLQRMGVRPALDFITQATLLSAEAALQKKLIDAIVPPEHIKTLALRYIAGQPAKTTTPLSSMFLETLSARVLINNQQQRKLAKTQDIEHYPAASRFMNLWQLTGSALTSLQPMELIAFQELLETSSTQNLLRLAELKDQLKALVPAKAATYSSVHIIGAGHVGREIAAWCSLSGLRVSIQEVNLENLGYALERIRSIFNTYFQKDGAKLKAATERISVDPEGQGIFYADLIIDATTDKLANKQELLARLEENSRPDALLAITSSTLPLERLAAVLLKPERLIGLHFLYPIIQHELMEIIHLEANTAPKVLEQAYAFVKQINKLPLAVQSTPGLVVNRILLTYIMQGIRLCQQNVPPVTIDKAGREFGMPLGPLEWADLLGLDYCWQLGDTLAKTSPLSVPDLLVDMVKADKLGRKNGTGFYRYRHGRMLKPERSQWEGSLSALQDKLINQMSEEAALCLEQGLIENPDLLDAAVVFGAGFPAFRGGPLQYARSSRK
ncbi:3-hydroxyacyl-CoA dehydrogenase / enoyl-CoA hydratase / 3-hydroxybutyryl-CoA epimerase [Thiothrix eikelboomii]|uniref:enoyl-CoA hydratase n=1 Tax=Thiothrix eikelboomii TaxID=92487 RepID=A0A1T4VXS3_9GAMM|nr:3-hydroxyacyl-CoA dehydrogenase NAD-binding domain-containing protein [Thiothrix eikelboomii]SKA69709.1 3-hydroxyacyl-CoA dehydrogenase / enoyl-CoA hydratase / 3-hydroxybutyryl-CoA epimerase [Thiothrix eikelboomii]